MDAPATPLQQMARVLSHRQALRDALRSGSHGSRTATLLQLLDTNGPMTSRDLADATGLTVKAVRNLLAAPHERGQAAFLADVGLWELNRDYVDADAKLRRAAELLRAAGWTVLPPQGAELDA